MGANGQNPLPESRRGKLDSELFKRHGLTIEQVKSCDALFLFNLLLPIHIPKLSGVENDKRMPSSQSFVLGQMFMHPVLKGIGADHMDTTFRVCQKKS